MAQPAQVFTNGYEYVVIDNGASPVTITVNGTPQTSNNWAPGGAYTAHFDDISSGANAQGKNAFSNGNIPDAVSKASSFTCTTAGVTNIIKYKNPA